MRTLPRTSKEASAIGLKCKPIGILEVAQTSKGRKERNDRIFVVPDRSPFESDLQDIRRLPRRGIEELEKFFEATDAARREKVGVLGMARGGQGNKDHQEDVALGVTGLTPPQKRRSSDHLIGGYEDHRLAPIAFSYPPGDVSTIGCERIQRLSIV